MWSPRPTPESVVALLAVLTSGATLVPLNPAATPAEIAYVVEDAEPTVAVTDRPDAAGVFGPGVTVLSVDDLKRSRRGAGAGAGATTTFVPPPLGAADDALIVYTSGTTGRPKGAVHTHASVLAGVAALHDAWGWHQTTASSSRSRSSTCTASSRGCSVRWPPVPPSRSSTASTRPPCSMPPPRTPCSSASRRCTTGSPPRVGAGELARLRLCVSGSAPLAADLWRQLAGEGVAVLERYGMTETLLTLSNPLEGERRPGSVGMPLPAVEAAIGDPDGDGVGELYVRGDSLCRGYWRRDDDGTTADGWFATGDLVSAADDGYVTIRGRRTELIITGGHNVYPAEVEAVLARHPGVRKVAVVGVPSPEWGETVEAFVVGDPDLTSLEDLATRELAAFKRPRQVHLVDELPRNVLGKVVRRDLRPS